MHSAWTRGRISSLHCQLDTAPWIKLLFFRLLGMLYGEKYISASKAFSKWRQSIKPARKKQSLVMVAFCSFTAFASSVIWVEEWGFHMHAGEADLCWKNPAVQGGIPAGKQSSCPFPDRARMVPGWVGAASTQICSRTCPQPALLLSHFSNHLSPLLFKETTLSSIRSSTCEPLSVIFLFYPRKEQIIPSLMQLKEMSKKVCVFLK